MAAPIAQWRTMTGIRRTSGTDTVRVLVEAYHKFAPDSGSSPNEVDSVVFTVTEPGGLSTPVTVSARALWLPNDTDLDDPLPARSGSTWGGSGPAPLWCHGVELTMRDFAEGTITVSAAVVPKQGTSYTLPTEVRIHNHSEGMQPPSTKVIWCSPSGSDTAAGTQANPVKSIQKACELTCTGGYGRPGMETTDHHWLTIEPAPGSSPGSVVVTRQSDQDDTWLHVNNPGSGAREFRARLRSLMIQTPGLPFSPQSTMTVHVWLDGCEERSPITSSIHLGCFDTCFGGKGEAVGIGGSGYRYVTGGYRHHVPISGSASPRPKPNRSA